MKENFFKFYIQHFIKEMSEGKELTYNDIKKYFVFDGDYYFLADKLYNILKTMYDFTEDHPKESELAFVEIGDYFRDPEGYIKEYKYLLGNHKRDLEETVNKIKDTYNDC